MAGEFKIKTGLALGASPHPVNTITNDHLYFSNDDTSALATVSSIKQYVDACIGNISTDVSLNGISDVTITDASTHDILTPNLAGQWVNQQKEWYVDSSIIQPVNDNYDVQLSAIQVEEDAGAVGLIDMPVSSTPAGGTEESYTFQLDSNDMLKIYGEADGTGGIKNEKVLISTVLETDSSVYFTGIDESSQTKSLYYNPTSGEVTYDDPCTGVTSVNWGDIGGTLSNQTDLQNALNDKQDDITFGTIQQIPYMNTGGDDFEYGNLEFNKNTGSLLVKGDQDTDNPALTLRDGSNNGVSLTLDYLDGDFTIGGDTPRLQLSFDNVCIGTTFSNTTTLFLKSASTGHDLAFWYTYNNDIAFRIRGDSSIYFPSLAEETQSKALYIDPLNGKITYADPCTGGGSLTDASLGGLTDASLNLPLSDNDIIYFDASIDKWTNREDYWTLDGSTLVPSDSTVDLKLGEIKLDEDGGAMTLTDMSVTSTPVAGTEESYSFNIDGSAVVKVYSEANGSGGLQETAFVVEGDYQYMGPPNTNGSWRFYITNDSSTDMVFEKRVGGSWVEKGRFN